MKPVSQPHSSGLLLAPLPHRVTIEATHEGRFYNMTIEQLRKDMIAAAKAKDKARKDAISALLSAAKKLAIDEGKRDNVPEELVDRAILKEQKSAKESLDSCPASRTDLLEEYQTRYDIISEYAPKMMSEDEIRDYLQKNAAEELASKNKGMIMKKVMPALKGKADGKTISQVVAELIK